MRNGCEKRRKKKNKQVILKSEESRRLVLDAGGRIALGDPRMRWHSAGNLAAKNRLVKTHYNCLNEAIHRHTKFTLH